MLRKVRVAPGRLFRHYKGGEYAVEMVAKCIENVDEGGPVNGTAFQIGVASAPLQKGQMVVGYAKYLGGSEDPDRQTKMSSNKVWFQPLDRFVETVEYEGKRVPRFAPVLDLHEGEREDEILPSWWLMAGVGALGLAIVYCKK